ncbi:hypothetical protein [Paraglaciecola sp.]|uniref:hypothetical protein n=1 Tax=Paraglaciecola sp. TaxID=1920173 RepID=UPI003EF3F168
MQSIKIVLIIIFIFTAGFLTSRVFFYPTPVKHDLQSENTSDVLHNIQNELDTSKKQKEITVKDINRYKDKIAQLENDLSQKYSKIKPLCLDQESKKSDEDLDNSNSERFASMTIKEAEAVLPKPYSDLVASTSGSMIEYLQEHIKDDVDYDWAPDMEQKIKDFIFMHPHSSEVELQSVTCKTSTCELMIVELEDFTWDRIEHDIRKQDWYKFSAGSSSTVVDSKNFIYIMLSKT